MHNNTLDYDTFKSLKKLYIIALSIIAFLVFISQIFIQRAIADNDYDANIINIAGKQRMLSQKISKGILLSINQDINANRNVKDELSKAVLEWKKAHSLLKNNLNSLNNSERKKILEKQFSKVTIEINELLNIYEHLEMPVEFNKEEKLQWIAAFIEKEPGFLNEMNQYVNDYEKYASSKVQSIKLIEYGAFGLLILLLLFEFFILFQPAAKKIRATLKELLETKNNAVKMAEKANLAVIEKRDTLEELQLLQKAIDQNLFFARIDKEGHIIHSGRKIKELINKQSTIDKRIIYNNLGLSESDQQQLQGLVDAQKGAILNREYQVNFDNSEIEWLDISVFPVVKRKGIIEYIIVCLDITSRKKAQSRIDSLNQEKLKEESRDQKAKASMIVEAQEEERKRIAKDIHDSIGQMLTALKFNIECLNTKDTDKLNKQVESLKANTKDIILGVRMATFNLTPPELLHYGVITAIQKMVTQLNKYSSAEVILNTELIDEDHRFESLVETNLYRVTQESINNAIKYAEASVIFVSIKITDELLSISITDDGKGFNVNSIPKRPKGGTEGGMGLFFMKERMEYINGRVFMNSEIGQGTRVVLNYPIPS